jgi:hypothetical protein
VLLWGDRWWFAGTGASCGFTNLVHAAEVLAAHFAQEPKPVRLRLIYQPDTLMTVAVACPPGDRGILAAALTGEFPALAHPDHAWSHEPVMAADKGHSTVLHLETEPGLFRLVEQLGQAGLVVGSAWPFATFLHALLQRQGNPKITLAHADRDEQAVVCYRGSNGLPAMQAWQGAEAEEAARQWSDELKAADDETLMIWTDPEEAEANNTAEVEEELGLHALSLAEALAQQVELPGTHPAQLLPHRPVITARRAVLAASVALLLAAGWAGFAYGRDWRAVQAETETRASRLAVLRAEVAHRRENAAEITALRSLVEGGSAGPPCGAFLQKVSATLPPEIALASLRIAGRSIELGGWTAPTAPAGTLDQWRGRLAPPDAPWTAAVRPGVGGAFTLTGAFRP